MCATICRSTNSPRTRSRTSGGITSRTAVPAGYLGTAFSRLTLQQKLAVGAEPEAILRKELSLAGYQRPLDPRMMPDSARPFFQVGEFTGWILETSEH
jgi:hypothetical protein